MIPPNECAVCGCEVAAGQVWCESDEKDIQLTAYLATQNFVELQEILFAHVIRSTPQLIRLIVTKVDEDTRQMLLDSFTEERRSA